MMPRDRLEGRCATRPGSTSLAEPRLPPGTSIARRSAPARGEDVILLSVGDPDYPTPAPIVAAAKASLDRGRTHYAEIAGQTELRAAIAAAPYAPVRPAGRSGSSRGAGRRPIRAVHRLPVPARPGRCGAGPRADVRDLPGYHRGRGCERPAGAAGCRTRLSSRPGRPVGGGDASDPGHADQLAP